MDAHPRSDATARIEARGSDPGEVADAFALLAEMTQDFADAMDLEATLGRGLSAIATHLEAEA